MIRIRQTRRPLLEPRRPLYLRRAEAEALARLLDHGSGMALGPAPTAEDHRALVAVFARLADVQRDLEEVAQR